MEPSTRSFKYYSVFLLAFWGFLDTAPAVYLVTLRAICYCVVLSVAVAYRILYFGRVSIR